ncbi:condensation domain-containing protein [[Clostridium] polysaccharolyticum]|uniref:Condensation domain-containing protein n=1 Tax=[Clostridium] polysaccharolyticum TaxID=29364 RepID=A0A1I0A0W3_9FIRM|nr:condensation domain-containing protein [[Clostridium] polysaccharolyticum]SES86782.1 Condensation domain-containing protein [[Clostridium] polysaccharolyticum]
MITKIKADRHYLFDPAAHIVMRVELSGKPDIFRIKRAIVGAVAKHDILNCTIKMDTKGDCFYVPREYAYIPKIEVHKGILRTNELVSNECKKEFKIDKGDLVRFVIAYDEERVELNVVQHHLGGDGKSMLILIQDILDILNSPEELKYFEDNQERCVNVIDDTYDEQYVELNDLIEATLRSLNKKWKGEKKIFHYDEREKVFQKFWEEREIEDHVLELDKEQLHSLLRVCKSHKVTLNNVVATVINKSLEEALKMGVIADVRDDDNKQMGNFVDIFILQQEYDRTKDFWENVDVINDLVKAKLEDRHKLLIGNLVRNKVENGLLDANHFQDFESNVVDAYSESFSVGKDGLPIMLTNIGVAPIKAKYGEFNIEKIIFVSPLTIRTFCNIAIITINDTFVLNMLTFKGDKRFEYLFDRIKEELLNVLAQDEKSEIQKNIQK